MFYKAFTKVERMIDKKSLEKEIDFIIVGQGLAGSLLAYHLLKQDQRIMIFGHRSSNTSSEVAAGIFNPITGKNNVLTWKAHQLFPYLHNFYVKLETELKANFFHPIPMYKPFTSSAEINDWMGKSTMDNYQFFIHTIYQKSKYTDILNDFPGGIELKQTGYVNTNTLLDELKKFFIKNQVYRESYFDSNSLILYDEKVSYKDLNAKKVIFCEGPEAINNKYFNWLPFALVKGELLDVEFNNKIDVLINKDIFILPITDKTCKVGATYDRKNLNNKVTSKGKKILEDKLQKLVKISYNVTGQKAGIRPASKDRRPYLGFHPTIKTLAIFNGLGSKGVSLAPFFANKMTRYLVFNEEIDREVNIFRYYQLYK